MDSDIIFSGIPDKNKPKKPKEEKEASPKKRISIKKKGDSPKKKTVTLVAKDLSLSKNTAYQGIVSAIGFEMVKHHNSTELLGGECLLKVTLEYKNHEKQDKRKD